jgi:HAMP domain-containing protein
MVSGGLLVLVLASLMAIWRARPRRPLRRMSHNIAAKMS